MTSEVVAGPGTAQAGPGTAQAGPTAVRVLVVDDNVMVRSGLRSLLESSGGAEVVGEAWDGHEAVRAARRLRPEVVLMDVRMPRRDGVSAVEEVSRWCPVLMLTFTEEPEVVRAAVEAGASGYVVHGSFDAEGLVAAVRAAAAGAGTFSASALEALRTPAPRRPQDHGLSERQVDVMDRVAAGLSNSEVASALFLSEKTVKNHLNHIFARLGVRTRSEAVALWVGTAPAAADGCQERR